MLSVCRLFDSRFSFEQKVTKSSISFRRFENVIYWRWIHFELIWLQIQRIILKKIRKTHKWSKINAFSLRHKSKMDKLLAMAVFYIGDKLRCVPKVKQSKNVRGKSRIQWEEMANNNNKWKRHSIKMYRMYKHKHSSPCDAIKFETN